MKTIDTYLEFLYGEENEVKVDMKVAGAVIKKKGDNGEDLILVIQRAIDDHWPMVYEFPRGKCDKGENEKLGSCLKREVKEETGLDIIPIKYLGSFQYLADKGTRRSTQYNFLCKMKNENQKVKLSKEHDSFKWIQSAGEAQLLLTPECMKIVLKAFGEKKNIVYPETNEKIVEK